MAIYASLTGAMVMAGIVMMVVAFRPAPKKRQRRNVRPTLPQRWDAISRRTKSTILLGLILGVATAALSGIVILVVVVPAAVIGLPLLLGKPDTRERDLLSALESWSRSLSSAAETGSFTLREVVSITRGSAPPILRVAIDRLNQRMGGSWSNSDALRQFAVEMNSAPFVIAAYSAAPNMPRVSRVSGQCTVTMSDSRSSVLRRTDGFCPRTLRASGRTISSNILAYG